MNEPGNIRERPRGLDRAALVTRVVNICVTMCTETFDLEMAALDLPGNSRLEDGAALEILDRLAIARAHIDIIRRILNSSIGHEIHDVD